MIKHFLISFVFFSHLSVVWGNTLQLNYEMEFEIGRNSYLANDWKNCVVHFDSAIGKFRDYQSLVNRCRLSCKKNVWKVKNKNETKESINEFEKETNDIENIGFFEKSIKETLCLLKCKRRTFGKNWKEPSNKEIKNEIENKVAYEYLHLCYSQLKEFIDAAHSAYTYLIYNPSSEVTREALTSYMRLLSDETFPSGEYKNSIRLQYSELINWENYDFVYTYYKGVAAYNDYNYTDMIQSMELSLTEYLETLEQCRLSCEELSDNEWFPDFMLSLSNHFTFCLRCKQGCEKKLSNINGDIKPDILPEMFHYLQYAYYKVGQLEKAAEAVESYLTLYWSEEMIKNKEYYSSLAKTEWFSPRDPIIFLVSREKREKELIQFIENKFIYTEEIEDKYNGAENEENIFNDELLTNKNVVVNVPDISEIPNPSKVEL